MFICKGLNLRRLKIILEYKASVWKKIFGARRTCRLQLNQSKTARKKLTGIRNISAITSANILLRGEYVQVQTRQSTKTNYFRFGKVRRSCQPQQCFRWASLFLDRIISKDIFRSRINKISYHFHATHPFAVQTYRQFSWRRLTQISSSFSSVAKCLLHIPLVSRMQPLVRNFFTYLETVVFGAGESENLRLKSRKHFSKNCISCMYH